MSKSKTESPSEAAATFMHGSAAEVVTCSGGEAPCPVCVRCPFVCGELLRGLLAPALLLCAFLPLCVHFVPSLPCFNTLCSRPG